MVAKNPITKETNTWNCKEQCSPHLEIAKPARSRVRKTYTAQITVRQSKNIKQQRELYIQNMNESKLIIHRENSGELQEGLVEAEVH